MRSLIFALGSIIFASSVLAADAMQLDVTKPTIAAQQQLILKTINGDPKYSEISESDRVAVISALQEVSELLEGGKTVQSLDPQSKQKVDFNQGEVNRLLAKAYRESRMVCVNAAPIGSNMIKRVCKTAAARTRESDFTRNNDTQVNQ